MKQLQEFYVDNELKKFGYSEQSVAKSLSAFKNGQEKGSPSVRTVGVYQKMQEALKKGQKVKVIIREVKGNQTPKEKCDKELEKYKSKNGNKYPEWNKKKNNDKWIKMLEDIKNVSGIGDSLFADIYGGKRNNMWSALVKTVEDEER